MAKVRYTITATISGTLDTEDWPVDEVDEDDLNDAALDDAKFQVTAGWGGIDWEIELEEEAGKDG